MAAFATVDAVRLRCGVDEATAAEELVTASLDDAHARVLARLTPEAAVEPVAEMVVTGESLLAGALLLRTLASRATAERRLVKVGGQSVERGKQGTELMALADRFELEAWELLAPHLAPAPAHPVVQSTASTPVL